MLKEFNKLSTPQKIIVIAVILLIVWFVYNLFNKKENLTIVEQIKNTTTNLQTTLTDMANKVKVQITKTN